MNDPRPDLVRTATADVLWDIVVIGGGASGLGCAVDAAARGYKTLLLEAHDYAKGTSSRSTKLVHGGVRYLAQGNLHLVRESLHERGVLRRNAPHLVHDLGFLVPAYEGWRMPFYGAGLKLYDLLAGRLNLRPSRPVSRRAALQTVPALKADGLKGGILYFDGQFDDARLAITLLRTFEDLSGVALNAAPVTGLIKTGGKVTGVRFRDTETGANHTVRAQCVINATGIFADSLRRMDDADAEPHLSPSQGVHVVVSGRFLPGKNAIMVPRTEDGRVLFVVPWQGHTLIGTTDTPVDHIELEPRALEAEIDFILRTAAGYLTPAPQRADILSVFAGLRPLVKASAADSKTLSREHVIEVSPSGLITLMGGKWTTYRRMGEDTVNRAVHEAGLAPVPCRTEDLRLHGWTEDGGVYGSDAAQIAQLPGGAVRLHPDFDYTEAQVRWAVRHEQARSVEDVLARRLRALLLDADASQAMAPRVAAILAEELGRDEAWQRIQAESYVQLAAGYIAR